MHNKKNLDKTVLSKKSMKIEQREKNEVNWIFNVPF